MAMRKRPLDSEDIVDTNQMLSLQQAANPFHDMIGPTRHVGQCSLAHLFALAPALAQQNGG